MKLAVDMPYKPLDMLVAPDMTPGIQGEPNICPEIDFERWLVPNKDGVPLSSNALMLLE